jgi:hypothetical protein
MRETLENLGIEVMDDFGEIERRLLQMFVARFSMPQAPIELSD